MKCETIGCNEEINAKSKSKRFCKKCQSDRIQTFSHQRRIRCYFNLALIEEPDEARKIYNEIVSDEGKNFAEYMLGKKIVNKIKKLEI